MIETQTIFKVFELPSEEEIQQKFHELDSNRSSVKALDKIRRIREHSFYKESKMFCLKVVYEKYVLKKEYELPTYHQVNAELELREEKDKQLENERLSIINQYVMVRNTLDIFETILINPIVPAGAFILFLIFTFLLTIYVTKG